MPTFPGHPLPAHPCPACGGRGLREFYAVGRIPVQSNLLMPTEAEALACPTGDLRLAACDDCGFITNTAYDPATQQLTARYEATQGFSPTFNAFARSLAEQWAERYDLDGKRAMEIGCGRGEFIALLCEVGGCAGVGIDPVADPARVPGPVGLPVTLIADYYSDRYAGLPADFVCCRHTLEHLPDVRRFVGMVRAVLGRREDVVVCFEVPDTTRVLEEGAVWDVYYEHCSYFTRPSLGFVFRDCGFGPMDERTEYDGQYLIIEPRPEPPPLARAWEAAEGAAGVTRQGVHAFRKACERQINRWRDVLAEAAAAGRRVALWGSGSKAVGFLT